tara:strand:+ start:174 stop:296 length:123 start_codon:yes stop_codon:yes gene_type:complete
VAQQDEVQEVWAVKEAQDVAAEAAEALVQEHLVLVEKAEA